MHADKVQLKQEELVGNGVVLTDINPVTATEAVMDESNGSTLAETLDRIYDIINSKLSRYVNSVNDRSGVVVLTASDVGLGKVDNVSFADIKEWVLEQINQAFRNKQLHLYNNMTDVLIEKETNDKSLDGAPFYAETGQIGDNRAYIGYFFWDDVSNTLQIDYKPIRTIGSSDGSISYDGNTGNISVQIHPNEEALQTTPQGMMIDGSKISRPCIFVDSLYGAGNQSTGTSDPTSMLATINQWKGAPIRIFINDTEIFDDSIDSTSPHYLNSEWEKTLRYGDTIITNFKSYINNAGQLPGYQTGSIACYDLQGQQPAIGSVTSVPDPDDPTSTYEVRFYTIKTYVGTTETNGCGLKYYPTHQSDGGRGTGQLGISFSEQISGANISLGDLNFSGMQALFNGTPNPVDPTIPAPSSKISVITPWGRENNIYNGMAIITDASLCTYPFDLARPAGDVYKDDDHESYFGSYIAKNWSIPIHGVMDPYDASIPYNKQTPLRGYASSKSNLSIKLNKLQIRPTGVTNIDGPFMFANISGIKISDFSNGPGTELVSSIITFDDVLKELGIPDKKDAVGNPIIEPVLDQPGLQNSGGCMVNVGKFLEICPKTSERALDYYEGGKVQVRIGKGLMDDIVVGMPFITEPDDWSVNYEAYRYIGEDHELHPIPTEMVLSTEDPGDDWISTYFNYYTNTGTSEDPVYEPVKRVYTDNGTEQQIPTWEADTYYSKVPKSFIQTLSDDGNVVKPTSTNRITLNIDTTTLAYNENDQLTVIGGGGGSGSTDQYIQLKFIDAEGQKYDYNPIIGGDQVRTKVVTVGNGLQMIGGTFEPDHLASITSLQSIISDNLLNISYNEFYEFATNTTSSASMTIQELETSPWSIIYGKISGLRSTLSHMAFSTLYNIYQELQMAYSLLESYDDADIGSNRDQVWAYENISDAEQRVVNILTSASQVSDVATRTTLINDVISHYSLDQQGITVANFESNIPNISSTMITMIGYTWVLGTFARSVIIANGGE